MKDIRRRLMVGCVVVAALTSAAKAGEQATGDGTETWTVLAQRLAVNDPKADAAGTTDTRATTEAPPSKGDPIPFHSIEGSSGGLITPMAYLCNAGAKGSVSSLPSVAYTFINLGSKRLQVVSVTQVFWNRVELGYAYNHFGVGSLFDDVRAAGLNMGRDHVHLHHFNVRVNMLPENSFDMPLPAVTGGVHFKYNDGIKSIDRNLGGAFRTIGYRSDNGVDYTLTATKMFPTLAIGRPVVVTGGLRFSNAAQLGLLGFGGEHNVTFEGSVAYLPIDQLCLAYEFRGKNNPYSVIPQLIGKEDNWHAWSASWIVNKHLTITGVLGALGNIANASSDCSLGFQVKWEI